MMGIDGSEIIQKRTEKLLNDGRSRVTKITAVVSPVYRVIFFFLRFIRAIAGLLFIAPGGGFWRGLSEGGANGIFTSMFMVLLSIFFLAIYFAMTFFINYVHRRNIGGDHPALNKFWNI